MVILSNRRRRKDNVYLLKWPWNPNKNFIAEHRVSGLQIIRKRVSVKIHYL